ncbi:MAG: hypothetical protein WEB52_07160 [Dehalococcoidia bacterium]
MLQDIDRWLQKRIPDEWFSDPADIRTDGEEILIVGTLPAAGQVPPADAIRAFREDTRERRMRIAAEAEQRFGRAVSWGVRCGDLRQLFTTYSVPVMTRLRMDEREVLDTLIASGVARTRSDALAWCVKLVAEHEGDWLKQLQEALVHVEKVRAAGPNPR